ncbi:hypothetical protein ASE68_04035 [Agromyces sp. Leaf222]|nr:hypothetical protein ASE68_04035 [Agromyces sp. Leaf222]
MSMTDNQASVVDEAAYAVRRTIRIAAPVDKVWRAVTEPEHISRWFGRTELDGTGPGARGSITFEGYGRVPLAIEAVDAPRSITYRWGNDDASGTLPEELDDHATVFTFTLEPVADGTELTLVETGFDRTSDPRANMADHAEGWVSELDKLVALLEGDA